MVIADNEVLFELESGTIGYAPCWHLCGEVITVRFQDENGNEKTEIGKAVLEL